MEHLITLAALGLSALALRVVRDIVVALHPIKGPRDETAAEEA
jgi:hypothetical protein